MNAWQTALKQAVATLYNQYLRCGWVHVEVPTHLGKSHTMTEFWSAIVNPNSEFQTKPESLPQYAQLFHDFQSYFDSRRPH